MNLSKAEVTSVRRLLTRSSSAIAAGTSGKQVSQVSLLSRYCFDKSGCCSWQRYNNTSALVMMDYVLCFAVIKKDPTKIQNETLCHLGSIGLVNIILCTEIPFEKGVLDYQRPYNRDHIHRHIIIRLFSRRVLMLR